MILDQFTFLFEKITTVFSVSNVDEKCRGYFQYFKEKEYNTLEKAVDHWVTKKPKFPSVAELLECYELFVPQKQFAGCDVCSGSGWVYPLDENQGVRRGNCSHGQALPEYAGPIYTGQTRYMNPLIMTENEKNMAWARDIMKDPVMFMKGYKFIAPILYRNNRELFDKVAMIARECLGEERFEKMFTNFKTFEQKTKMPFVRPGSQPTLNP
jgi:hypothetical protein